MKGDLYNEQRVLVILRKDERESLFFWLYVLLIGYPVSSFSRLVEINAEEFDVNSSPVFPDPDKLDVERVRCRSVVWSSLP